MYFLFKLNYQYNGNRTGTLYHTIVSSVWLSQKRYNESYIVFLGCLINRKDFKIMVKISLIFFSFFKFQIIFHLLMKWDPHKLRNRYLDGEVNFILLELL